MQSSTEGTIARWQAAGSQSKPLKQVTVLLLEIQWSSSALTQRIQLSTQTFGRRGKQASYGDKYYLI